MKYQIIEILERIPFRTKVSEPTDFHAAARLFGERWYQAIDIYMTDEQGNVIAHFATSGTVEKAPNHIISAAGLTIDYTIEVERPYGSGLTTCYLDIDGKITLDGRNAHVFTSYHEASEVARVFNMRNPYEARQVAVRPNVYRKQKEAA